ncbi:hepatic leukemia factor [Drosophila sulfurigaster albostrigata]|uniref:hepatic leukemia factor n=1 Tax=Drosophila sulfurigaster albostrigata TaxID=89887 RepID=UPI002D21E2B3|nr:hepatic leukemia factor [Drosophila sulfurigaster albostrigata]
MYSPAKSPIVDVTETLSLHSELDIELEPSGNTAYSIAATHNLRLPGLPGLTIPSLLASKSNGSISGATLPAFEYIAPPNHALQSIDFPLMELNRVGMFPGFLHRRARGEKRPIPDAQKDAKYYERRKRNNEAAKKSRDARKIREDRIAFRAALLEQENSILRAQVLALRDELQTVRQLLGATAGGMLGVARQV